MRHLLTYSTVFFLTVSFAQRLSVGDEEDSASKKSVRNNYELLATADQGIGFGILYSRGPRIAVYRDGMVIFAKRKPKAAEATYFVATLPPDDFQRLDATLRAANRVVRKDLNLAPGGFDLPGITVSLHYADDPKRFSVYGYAPDGYAGPATFVPTEKRPDKLPAEIDSAVKALLAIEPKGAREWRPDLVEVNISSSLLEQPKIVHVWPDKWPNVESKTTRQIQSKPKSYSIVIPGEELIRFLRREKESAYFRIGDNVWLAYYWRPMLPGTERWQQYQHAREQ